MIAPVPVGELLAVIAARVGELPLGESSRHVLALSPVRVVLSAARDGQMGPGAGKWLLTLCAVLVGVALGTGMAHVVRRWVNRSTPELTILLNESAAFYSRWAEHDLASAPRRETAAEAARCRRIIELLQERAATSGDESGWRGPIDGLRAWLAVLRATVDAPPGLPAGVAPA